MSYQCRTCHYETNHKHHLTKHYSSEKHKRNIKRESLSACGKFFEYPKNFRRHIKDCSICQESQKAFKAKPSVGVGVGVSACVNAGAGTSVGAEVINNITIKDSPGATIITGDNNTLTKIDKLNLLLNETNMIDLETFMFNYENNPRYQLTKHETNVILENFQYNGFKALSFDLPFYLKAKCQKQLQDFKGVAVQRNQVILPIIATDCGLRSYIQKKDEEWRRTSDMTNIKKLIVITSDQIYKHHNQFLDLTTYQMNVVANTVLQNVRYDEEKIILPEYQNKNSKFIGSLEDLLKEESSD